MEGHRRATRGDARCTAMIAPSTAMDSTHSAPPSRPKVHLPTYALSCSDLASDSAQESQEGLRGYAAPSHRPWVDTKRPHCQTLSAIGQWGDALPRVHVRQPSPTDCRPPWQSKRGNGLPVKNSYCKSCKVCSGGPGEPSNVTGRSRPRPLRPMDGPDALGAREGKSPVRERG